MKKLVTLVLVLSSSLSISQSLKGIWHGKIYDFNGDAVKYINVSIDGEGKKLVGTLRNYNKADDIWQAQDTGVNEFLNVNDNAILSVIDVNSRNTESNVFLFSYVNSKRLAVEWVNQINNLDTSSNVLTKQGSGYLEPFFNGTIYESLSIGGTSTNRVSIDKVEIADELTVITFSYHNTSFEQVMMRLSKPGETGAYYITPPDRSKKYYIVDKDNIAFGPDNTLVAPNSYHTFKIYFEPLPDSLKSFSILEGNPEMQSGKEWNFYDIQLK